MNLYLAAAALTLLLTAATPAAQADPTALQGVVKSVDPATHMVVLEDGTTFQAAKGVEVDTLRPGSKVILYYYVYDGRNTIVSYEYMLGE